MTQLVKCLPSGWVIISGSWDGALPQALWSVGTLLFLLSLWSLSLSLSPINKWKSSKKKCKKLSLVDDRVLHYIQVYHIVILYGFLYVNAVLTIVCPPSFPIQRCHNTFDCISYALPFIPVTHSITGRLCLPHASLSLSTSPPSSLVTITVFSAFVGLFLLFVCVFVHLFKIPHMGEMVFVLLWVISVNISEMDF